MSIVVTSNAEVLEQTQSVQSDDKAQAQEAAKDEASSAEAQGEETKETVEATSKDEAEGGEDEGEEPLAAEEKPKKKSGIQRLKERHAREMAAIHREIESLKSQDPKGQRQSEVEMKSESLSEGKPVADKFDTHEEFVEALTDWKLEQREKANLQKSKEAQAKNAYQDQIKRHNDRVAKFKESAPEFDDVIAEFVEEHGDVKFSPGLEQSIFDSDNGPAVLLELAKNPEEFDRINRLPPFAAAREIGKIEARVAGKESKKPETKTTTKAPPPLKTVGTGASGVKKTIFNAESQAEYERARLEQMSKRNSAWG